MAWLLSVRDTTKIIHDKINPYIVDYYDHC